MQARLQEEVSNLLYDYVPLDGFEMETIHFNEVNSSDKGYGKV
jgi:hypothetical protein